MHCPTAPWRSARGSPWFHLKLIWRQPRIVYFGLSAGPLGTNMRDWRTLRQHSCALGSAVLLLMAVLPVSAATPAPAPMPRIGHVFILMLENQGYQRTFGPQSAATYLNQLVARGALLKNYYATSHFSLGNYITLISGQAANAATANDCPRFEEFIQSGMAPDGQAIGAGCVYPASIPTIAQQLEARHLSWKA